MDITKMSNLPLLPIAIKRSIHTSVRSSESHANHLGRTEQAPTLVFPLKEAAPLRASSTVGLANSPPSTFADLHGSLAVSLNVFQTFNHSIRSTSTTCCGEPERVPSFSTVEDP